MKHEHTLESAQWSWTAAIATALVGVTSACSDGTDSPSGPMPGAADPPGAVTPASTASPTENASEALPPVGPTPTNVTQPGVDVMTATVPPPSSASPSEAPPPSDVPPASQEPPAVFEPVPVGDRTPESVCARWNEDRSNLSEGTWSGSVGACDAGDISSEGRANALRLVNLYRWLADRPPVTTEPERDQLAQQCALLQEANNALSHNPPMDWECWTQVGADGAATSNISTGPGVSSIDAYMIDAGNETTIGHRRWTLSNSLGPIGLGSTGNGASCFQNLRGEGELDEPWTAWPAPGLIPFQAFVTTGRSTLDETGWTLQSDSIDLGDAVVNVTAAGIDMPVTVTQLDANFGSRFALRFNPDGWETEPNQVYAVNVSGVDSPIAYDVQVIDCQP